MGSHTPNIKTTELRMVPVAELKSKLNPLNSNYHPPEQIEELVEQFKFQGVRHPVIISKRSGLVAAGEGRIKAAELAGMKEYPVSYQDFESEAQEYAFGIADNATAAWATLDLSKIHKQLPDIEPFDISRLAIKDFRFEPADNKAGEGSERKNPTLADRFGVPPFSVLDARQGYWQNRKREWLALGIKSELGRGGLAHDQPGGDDRESQLLQKPKTLGAIAPNEKQILKRTGKYSAR